MPATGTAKKKYGLGKAKTTVELDLPSGETCLVIRPGIEGLIKHGILDSLDSLTSIVQVDHIDANDPKKMAKAVQAAAQRPQDLLRGMEVANKVVCYVVQQPEVRMPPESDEDRDPDVLYADEVDMDDRMFIFQFVVGGTRDLEAFRAQREELLGGLSTGEDVQM